MKTIVENKVVSFLILTVRLYLGVWFIHHAIAQSMYKPESWLNIGAAVNYVGINFFPQFWGFMAFFVYIVGGLLLISGVWSRLAAAGLAIVLLVAANMHFALGHGFAVAKNALLYLVIFLILIWTGPGIYTINRFLKKLK